MSRRRQEKWQCPCCLGPTAWQCSFSDCKCKGDQEVHEAIHRGDSRGWRGCTKCSWFDINVYYDRQGFLRPILHLPTLSHGYCSKHKPWYYDYIWYVEVPIMKLKKLLHGYI